MQKNDPILSEACETRSTVKVIWGQKFKPVQENDEKRFKQAMTSEIFLANMTDPNCFDARLTHVQEKCSMSLSVNWKIVLNVWTDLVKGQETRNYFIEVKNDL